VLDLPDHVLDRGRSRLDVAAGQAGMVQLDVDGLEIDYGNFLTNQVPRKPPSALYSIRFVLQMFLPMRTKFR
jgi:hypothetical protein